MPNALLEIKTDHTNGYGEFLRGEYGVGYGSGFAAIVTAATLDMLKTIGVVNNIRHLMITDYRVSHLAKLDPVVRESIVTIMNNSPKFVGHEHVKWENTKRFFNKPGSGVFPAGQVVWMMLRELGLKEVESPWVETVTPIAFGSVFED